MFLDVMFNVGVVFDDIIYNIFLEVYCKYGNLKEFEELWNEKGFVYDYVFYIVFINEIVKVIKVYENR